MSSLSTARVNARQFLELGEDPPGIRLELADGEIIVSPSPTPKHSTIVLALAGIIRGHAVAQRLGQVFADTDTLFQDDNVRRPDLSFVSAPRLHLVGEQAVLGPPDLCIEVISRSSATMDRVNKFELYEASGVRHYWLVDPHAQMVEAYVLIDGKYRLAVTGRGQDHVVLPPFGDLTIDLAAVWPEV